MPSLSGLAGALLQDPGQAVTNLVRSASGTQPWGADIGRNHRLKAIVRTVSGSTLAAADTTKVAKEESSAQASRELTRTPTATVEDEACSICLAEPSPQRGPGSRDTVSTPCGHVFCRDCLAACMNPSLAQHDKCPMCRAVYGEAFMVQVGGISASKYYATLRAVVHTAAEAFVDTPFRMLGVAAMVRACRFTNTIPLSALSIGRVVKVLGWR